MTYTTTEEFAVLHGLRIKGMSTAGPVSVASGVGQREVQAILDDAVARGLARSRTGGRVEGYMLTGPGRERHRQLRGTHVTEADERALAPAYEDFLAPNRAFKEVTSRWQTEGHSVDAVLPELERIHGQVGLVVTAAGAAVPRMKSYRPRFDRALAALREGDTDALARPMSDSYHDVWMELHEDLLVTLGRERSDDDE